MSVQSLNVTAVVASSSAQQYTQQFRNAMSLLTSQKRKVFSSSLLFHEYERVISRIEKEESRGRGDWVERWLSPCQTALFSPLLILNGDWGDYSTA